MNFRQTMFSLLALGILCIETGYAQIPRSISYQGVFTDSSGAPKPDGQYSFTFSLYSVSTGGSCLWSETKSLQLSRGLFYTILGDQNPFPDSIKFNQAYWFGITIGAGTELIPRVELTSVAYSLRSLHADTADYAMNVGINTGSIDSTKLATNSVTSSKIASGQVVKSINSLKDIITLSGSSTISITPNNNTLTFSTNATIGGTGTTKYLPYFTSSNTIANSLFYQDVDHQFIGLGTASPVALLDIDASSNPSDPALNVNGRVIFGHGGFTINADEEEDARINAGGIILESLSSGVFITGVAPLDGDILDVGGIAIANGWATRSSIRWKTNIQTIDNALEKVERLRGVTFDWKKDGKHDIGLIAEETGKVLPEIVKYEVNGIDAQSIDYSRIVALLIEAVKDQQKEIETLQRKVNSLSPGEKAN